MWSVFPLVRKYLKGATASSLNETRLCFEEMKTRAHVYSPVYFEDEFEELMDYSSHIVFNSINQFKKYYPETLKADHYISCGLRVNPEYSDVATDLYNPSAAGSRLGIGSDEFPDELPPSGRRPVEPHCSKSGVTRKDTDRDRRQRRVCRPHRKSHCQSGQKRKYR